MRDDSVRTPVLKEIRYNRLCSCHCNFNHLPSFPYMHPYWNGTPQFMFINMTTMLAWKAGYRRCYSWFTIHKALVRTSEKKIKAR